MEYNNIEHNYNGKTDIKPPAYPVILIANLNYVEDPFPHIFFPLHT